MEKYYHDYVIPKLEELEPHLNRLNIIYKYQLPGEIHFEVLDVKFCIWYNDDMWKLQLGGLDPYVEKYHASRVLQDFVVWLEGTVRILRLTNKIV